MKQKLSAIILIAAVVLIAACGKKAPGYTKYIPKEASYVVAVDVKSMITKLEQDSLSVNNMLEVLKDSTDPSKYAKAVELWNQFKDAGLDLDNKVYLAMPAVNLMGGNITFQVIAGLKDEKKLQDFIAKTPGAPKVTAEGDISYVTINEMLVGWNKEAVMILAGGITPALNGMYNQDDTTVSLTPVPAPVPGGSSALITSLKNYFSLSKANSIASLDVFTDLVGQKGDLAIFTNTSSLSGVPGAGPLAMMPKVKALTEGIFSTSLLNFDDGKVEMKNQTFVGPELAGILKKYAGPEVDMSLVDAYPGNNINGIAAFSFKPEIISALMQEAGVDALADGFLSQQGLSTAEIVKAFKGDFAVIFSDFTISKVQKVNPEDQSAYTSYNPSAKLLVAIRIGDKAAFEKLLSMATKTGMVMRQGNRLVAVRNGAAVPNMPVSIGIENDLLLFSNDEATYTAYASKSGKSGLSGEATDAIKGASVGFYLDAAKLLNGIPVSMLDSGSIHQENILAKSKDLFKSMDFRTSNFDGKKLTGTGKLVMQSNKNSLPQLVRFLMYAAGEMKLKSAEDSAKWRTDSEENMPDTMALPLPVK